MSKFILTLFQKRRSCPNSVSQGLCRKVWTRKKILSSNKCFFIAWEKFGQCPKEKEITQNHFDISENWPAMRLYDNDMNNEDCLYYFLFWWKILPGVSWWEVPSLRGRRWQAQTLRAWSWQSYWAWLLSSWRRWTRKRRTTRRTRATKTRILEVSLIVDIDFLG